jgi:uroporphyrinogen decarboxylase
MFGNLHQRATNGEYVTYAVIKPAFEDINDIDYIKTYPFPDYNIVNLEQSIKYAEKAAASGRAVTGGVWASLFTQSRSLMGEERFLYSLYDEPELVNALVSSITDMYISWNEAYLKACGKYIDIYYFGSDFGTQKSMFISAEHFVKFFKENMRRIVTSAKKYVGTVMFHTCGAVFDIIPHLIDIGIDILDPVQADAYKMSPEILSGKYKSKICFHGAVSTQTTLPFGTPEEVAAQVENIINIFGPSGLIIGPDQDMIGYIPVENIDALYCSR